MGKATLSKTLMWKAAALVGGLGLGILSCPVHAATTSGGDTVQGLYDALLSSMKNGRILGQSGRFTQLAPVIRHTFDIASMARLSIGPAWTGLSDAQRQQATESFGRYISAIYADRFDSYNGQKLEVTGEQPAPSGVMHSGRIGRRVFLLYQKGRAHLSGSTPRDRRFETGRRTATSKSRRSPPQGREAAADGALPRAPRRGALLL